jgi:hypothetical protein
MDATIAARVSLSADAAALSASLFSATSGQLVVERERLHHQRLVAHALHERHDARAHLCALRRELIDRRVVQGTRVGHHVNFLEHVAEQLDGVTGNFQVCERNTTSF